MNPGTATPLALPARARRAALLLPLLTALVAASLLGTAPAVQAGEQELAAAFDRLQQAVPGEDSAIDDAAQRFQRLLVAHPADPVLRAYAGATTSLRATTTMLPWRKIGHAEDGLALIDKALAMLDASHDAPLHRGVPAVLETRFVAASTFLRLPAMFNRHERGRQQLEQVLASPLFDTAPAAFRATVWLRAARLAQDERQPEQARAWLEKAAATSAPQAATARQRLAEL